MKTSSLKNISRVLIVILIIVVIYFIYSFAEKNTSSNKSKGKRAIIIGDSQTPFIAKQSEKVKMLGQIGGEDVLWKGGQNLNWLLNAVKKYPVTKDVGYVVINIGTNGGFNIKDNILGLVNEIKRVFPNATLLGVKGSWGWGGNINKTEKQVNDYYNEFAKLGVKIIPTPIGAVEPHGDRPSYKKIGKELDSFII
jgi:uncharacterized protein (UPF0333 family)